MAWKRRPTTQDVGVGVDLDKFDTGQLLQSLIDRGVITPIEAETLSRRKPKSTPPAPPSDGSEDIELARRELRLGRTGEAPAHVERALGTEFIGRLVQP